MCLGIYFRCQRLSHLGQHKTNKNQQKMKTLKMLFTMCFGSSTCFAKLSDIKGNKSGGVRDGNKVDWRSSNGSTS